MNRFRFHAFRFRTAATPAARAPRNHATAC